MKESSNLGKMMRNMSQLEKLEEEGINIGSLKKSINEKASNEGQIIEK